MSVLAANLYFMRRYRTNQNRPAALWELPGEAAVQLNGKACSQIGVVLNGVTTFINQPITLPVRLSPLQTCHGQDFLRNTMMCWMGSASNVSTHSSWWRLISLRTCASVIL